MSNGDIVRAWKDAEYRASLSESQREQLPEHPAGAIELAEEELHQAAGGNSSDSCLGPLICTHQFVCFTNQ